MKRTKIIDLFAPEQIGKEVSVMGWVRTRRGNKHVQFVALNDGSTIKNIQVVFDMAKFTEDQLRPVTTGSSVHVTGTLCESMGKGQSVEVQADTLEVLELRILKHIHCRKKDIPSSFFVKKPICVRAPIPSGLC